LAPIGDWRACAGPRSGAEGQWRVPFPHPCGQAVGENGDHLAADGSDPARRIRQQGARELGEPVRLHQDIVVSEHDHLATGLGQCAVAGMVEPLLRLADVARRGIRLGELRYHRRRVVRELLSITMIS
jgi:hypothetical protein